MREETHVPSSSAAWNRDPGQGGRGVENLMPGWQLYEQRLGALRGPLFPKSRRKCLRSRLCLHPGQGHPERQTAEWETHSHCCFDHLLQGEHSMLGLCESWPDSGIWCPGLFSAGPPWASLLTPASAHFLLLEDSLLLRPHQLLQGQETEQSHRWDVSFWS